MGNIFDRMANSNQPDQSAAQAPEIPEPVVSPALDQRASNDPSIKLHGVSQAELDANTIPASQSGNIFDRMAHDTPAEGALAQKTGDEQKTTPPQKPTRVGQMPHLHEVWEGISEPLVPEARPGTIPDALHKYADSAPTEFSMNHPKVAATLKGLSGTVYDTMETLRSFTSPIAIGTLGLGELAEGSGAAPKVAKAGSRLLGVGFGAQGMTDAYEGIKEGDIHKTLNGLGQALISTAAELKGTKLGGKAPVETRKGTTAGDRTILRPTTQTTAGVEAPIAATQQVEPSAISKVMSHTTSPGTATEFQDKFTKPAARRQAISTLSQVATDKIAAHDALANGEAAPASITGTQTPGEHLLPQDMWKEMQDSAGQTWDKARRVSAQELEDWNRKKTAAETSHQEAIDHYNELVNNHNADPANENNQLEQHTFDPKDANIPERPKTYDELKAELDYATDRTGQNNPTDVREKAKTVDVPKAEKALDKWFQDHEDAVNSSEYQSAKKLWADSLRFKEIDLNISRKLATGNLSGNDIRGIEAVVDNAAKRRRGQAGIGEFKRLMGPEAVENLNNVAKLFDPLEKTDPRSGAFLSWGSYIAKHVVTTMMAPILGVHYLALEGGNALNELLMNHVMFDPEFGSSFKGLVDATKAAFSAGTKVPAGLINKFQDMLSGIVENYKASKFGGEEGAVGAGVKRAKVGPRAGKQPLAAEPVEKDDTSREYKDVGNGVHQIVTKSPEGNSQGQLLAKDVEGNPSATRVVSHWVENESRGQGLGAKQLVSLAENLASQGKTTMLSDLEMTDSAKRAWDKLKAQYPDAVTKANSGYIFDLTKLAKTEPVNDIATAADEYNKAHGLPSVEHAALEPDVRRGEIADAFDAMKHDPTDPKVAASYDALKKEIKDQWEFATKKMGVKIEPTDQDPYGFSGSGKPAEQELFDDVKNNKHLGVWRGGNPLEKGHPLAEIDPQTGESYNTMLRAVHDLFGHVAAENKFGEAGEESAWNLHKQMFSKKAMPAMTTETRGQTSWFFNNADVRSGKKALGEFASQKAGLLPEFANDRTEVNQHIADITNQNGGATFNPTRGNMAGTDAYAVPMHPELSRTVSGEKVTPEQVKKYLSDPAVKAALASDPKLSVGTWAHEGKVYFDISAAVRDRAEAIRLGKENNQKAITYLKNFEEIPLGKEGTGTALEPKTFAGMDFSADRQATDQAMKELADGKITRDQLMSRAQELKEQLQSSGEDTGFDTDSLNEENANDEAAYRAGLAQHEIATRQPSKDVKDKTTGKTRKITPPNDPSRLSGLASLEEANNTPSGKGSSTELSIKQKLVAAFADYEGTGLGITQEDIEHPDQAIEKIIDHIQDNYHWVYDQMPESIRKVAQDWYETVHNSTKAEAEKTGLSHPQVAGVTAVLSPQNPWDNNRESAYKLIDLAQNARQHQWTPEMDRKLQEIKGTNTTTKKNAKGLTNGQIAFGKLTEAIRGKKYSDFDKEPDREVRLGLQALWLRVLDEAHTENRDIPVMSPQGEIISHAGTRAWPSVDTMAGALDIIQNGMKDGKPDLELINEHLGGGNKVRNFYNNMINPWSERGHFTADTHQVGAGMLQSLSSKSKESMHNFGSGNAKGIRSPGKNGPTGVKGTYPVYQEAGVRAAKAVGVRPNQFQSMTWEGVRSLLNEDKKTETLSKAIRTIWSEHEEGLITKDQARRLIMETSGGFRKPEWMSQEDWDADPSPNKEETVLANRSPEHTPEAIINAAQDRKMRQQLEQKAKKNAEKAIKEKAKAANPRG